MTQTAFERLSSDVRKLAEHVGLVKPEPKRAHPPLSEEERTAINSQLKALRAEWAKTEAKLRAPLNKAAAVREEKLAALEAARAVEREAFHALMAVEDEFRAEESSLVDRLRHGAPSTIAQLGERLEAMIRDLKSTEARRGYPNGVSYYENKRHELAVAKRVSALEELRLTIRREWSAFGDDESGLLARFSAELARTPAIDAIVAEMMKPAPPAPARVIDAGVPNPSLKDPKIVQAHNEMWSTPGARRPGVTWHDAA